MNPIETQKTNLTLNAIDHVLSYSIINQLRSESEF